jgi:predicted RNase H-like HicB family nuclease
MHSFAVSIVPEGEWFIARCPELNVTSQGRTLEEAQANIREAIVLYIESFGHCQRPRSTVSLPPRLHRQVPLPLPLHRRLDLF